MINDIKLNQIRDSTYQQLTQTRSNHKAAPLSDQAHITNKLEDIIQRLLDEPPPGINQSRITEIKAAMANGTYSVDSEKLAQQLLNEYFPSHNNGNIDGSDK